MVRSHQTIAPKRIIDSILLGTDWNPITREQIFTETLDPLSSYAGSKTLAERAVWEFVAEHPDINITVCKHLGFGAEPTDLTRDPQ